MNLLTKPINIPVGGRKFAIPVFGFLIALCCLCTICGGITSSMRNTGLLPTETPGLIELALSPEPTNTPGPSSTPAPTGTPAPTDTPGPTNTPAPTQTPLPPTATVQPTSTPEPVVLAGTGDSIVDVKKWDGPALAHITGNASSRFFAITNYDADNNKIDLLVNTTDNYDGIKGIDFNETSTTRLEIKAVGKWRIEILPMTSARVLEVPGKIEGNGDDVIVLRGGKPDIANITGNAASRFFAILGWDENGRDLLVNTTDVYDGQVLMSGSTFLLEITAEGKWTIDVAGK